MTKPYRYQLDGAKRLQDLKGRALLADEMGLGKSLQVILWLQNNPQARPCVIVCPASLKWNWQKELSIHAGWHGEILESTTPHKNGLHRPAIVIINYDVLKPWLPWLLTLRPQTIVLDECHMLQSRKTLRTRSCRILCRSVPHVLALSGTPLTSRPADMWPTLNILRADLFPSFWEFAQSYCDLKRNPWGWEWKGAKDLPALHKLLTNKVMIRRKKADVLTELPAKRRFVVPLEIKDRKEYTEAHRDLISWLRKQGKGQHRSAARAEGLARFGHLKQLAAWLKLDAVEDWIDNWLEESEGKLIIFAHHRQVIHRLREKYSKISVMVWGDTPGKMRQRAVDQFQLDRRTRLFIGQLDAAGIGINLTAAEGVAFAELGWKPSQHTQGEDRAHRIGQARSTGNWYLVARDTIEERICRLLNDKQKVLDEVLDGGNGEDFDIYNQLMEQLVEGKSD